MQKASLVLLVFLSFTLPFKAQAGWVISNETSDHFGNKSYQTIFIEGNLMRFETPSSISIFNLDDQIITLIFAQHQAYWQGTAVQLREEIFDIADRQMQELIQHAPPQQQDTLRKMYKIAKMKRQSTMNDTLPTSLPDVSIIKTNHTETILGYPTRKYQVNVDSVLVEELWVTNAVNPYSRLNLKAMVKLISAMDPVSGNAFSTKSFKYDSLLYHGLVLKKIRFLPNGDKQLSVVKSIRKVNINETIFEIPANYMETKIQEVMLQDINQNILKPHGISNQGNQGLPSLPPPLKVPVKKKNLNFKL